MEDDLKKIKMEDNLNFKAVLSSLFNNKNLKNLVFINRCKYVPTQQNWKTTFKKMKNRSRPQKK